MLAHEGKLHKIAFTNHFFHAIMILAMILIFSQGKFQINRKGTIIRYGNQKT